MTAAVDAAEGSIAVLAAALRDGRTSAEMLAETAIERRREALGAYKTWRPDAARAHARAADAAFAVGADLGPLQGLPVSVKDIYGLEGWPTFAGSPRELPPAWQREGPVVARLRQQLPVIPGKTHTVEFAFGGLGSNPHWPPPRNPWDAETPRVAGGSSSGAGVSLQEGSAVLALGTDTAGSVRIPAAMTGSVGLKTTHGRWSIDGIVPLSPSLDTAGVLVRTVADAALGFAALDGPAAGWRIPEPPALAGLTFGVPEDFFWADCDPGVAEAVRAAIGELTRAGAQAVSRELPQADPAYAIFREGGLAAPEFYEFLRAELPDWLEALDPNVRGRMEATEDLKAWAYLNRRRRLRALGSAANANLAGVDALLTPTVPVTPPAIADLDDPKTYRRANLLALRNTSVVNYLRLSALSLPVGLDTAGLPVGLQVIMPAGADERLIAVGLAIERALGTGRERLGRAPLGA